MAGRPQADDPVSDKRTEPAPIGDERAILTGFLNYQRQTLLLKCAGLAGAELDALTVQAHPRTGERYSLRWILAHLIEEYARHNGHADLLREAIDGVVGE